MLFRIEKFFSQAPGMTILYGSPLAYHQTRTPQPPTLRTRDFAINSLNEYTAGFYTVMYFSS